MIPVGVGKWFKQYRESYTWPDGRTRQDSEKCIDSLLGDTRSAMDNGDAASLQQSLMNIHSWKNNNMRGITSKYWRELEAQGYDYVQNLLGMSTFNNTNRLEDVVNHLKIRQCNLPTCTAIASFMYGRVHVPVVDKFVAQFFARKFNRYDLDANTTSVLQWIRNIPFRIEEGGSGRLRLAVFNNSGYQTNLRLYIQELIPECARIADALNLAGYTYTAIDGSERQYAPVDVEMAIFSWSSRNRHLFG